MAVNTGIAAGKRPRYAARDTIHVEKKQHVIIIVVVVVPFVCVCVY